MSNDLEQRVHALIYDADPEIPAAAVIAAVRAAVADEIRALKREGVFDSEDLGWNGALNFAAARIADPSRAKEQK